MRALENTGRTVRIPSYLQWDIRCLRRAVADLQQILGNEPDPFEIAADLGWPVEKVHRLQGLFGPTEYLATHSARNNRATVDPPQESYVARREVEDVVHTSLRTLKPREQEVLRMRFGIDDGGEHTQPEIGRELGISKQRVEQVEAAGLAVLARRLPHHPAFTGQSPIAKYTRLRRRLRQRHPR